MFRFLQLLMLKFLVWISKPTLFRKSLFELIRPYFNTLSHIPFPVMLLAQIICLYIGTTTTSMPVFSLLVVAIIFTIPVNLQKIFLFLVAILSYNFDLGYKNFKLVIQAALSISLLITLLTTVLDLNLAEGLLIYGSISSLILGMTIFICGEKSSKKLNQILTPLIILCAIGFAFGTTRVSSDLLFSWIYAVLAIGICLTIAIWANFITLNLFQAYNRNLNQNA